MSLRMAAGTGAGDPPDARGTLERHIGRQLHRQRLAFGLSCAQLAAAIGVTLQQVRNYERGINRLNAARLYELASALGVEVGYFFEGAGESAPPIVEDAEVAAQQAETMELLRAYAGIPDRAVRHRVLGLLRQLADAEELEGRPISKID